MNITFLGTGTSQGIPVIGCGCVVCRSTDERDKRLRTSVMVEDRGSVFVIDTGPDFRQQMLREKVNNLDAVLFTHEHKDHIAGLDDVRAYNYLTKRALPIFASHAVTQAIRRDYHYVFSEQKYPGVPELEMNLIGYDPFSIKDTRIIPIQVFHHTMPVTAFRINDFTYITDATRVEPAEMEKIRGTKTLVINALRRESHISHFTLQQALQFIDDVNPESAFLIHLSHQMGLHQEVEMELPTRVRVAFDGLRITV